MFCPVVETCHGQEAVRCPDGVAVAKFAARDRVDPAGTKGVRQLFLAIVLAELDHLRLGIGRGWSRRQSSIAADEPDARVE